MVGFLIAGHILLICTFFLNMAVVPLEKKLQRKYPAAESHVLRYFTLLNDACGVIEELEEFSFQSFKVLQF